MHIGAIDAASQRLLGVSSRVTRVSPRPLLDTSFWAFLRGIWQESTPSEDCKSDVSVREPCASYAAGHVTGHKRHGSALTPAALACGADPGACRCG